MSQLIKATITPYEAVHFRQNARLVSSGNLDAERRRLMAIQASMQHCYTGSAVSDPHYTDQVRRAFSGQNKPQQSTSDSMPVSEPVVQSQPKPAPASVSYQPTAASASDSYMSDTVSLETSAYIEQAQASYDMEKASFDLRISTGELSYVPAFDFKIVLQRPGVEFEYLGGFNYVPPSWSPIGENINMLL